MGDIGALAVGAALGTIAVIVRQEIVLLIMGGVFVMETVSVMLQVASFKLTGQAHLPHGADPPPFRTQGLAGAARDRALLDHQRRAGAGRSRHVEGALMNADHQSSQATRRSAPQRALRHGHRAVGDRPGQSRPGHGCVELDFGRRQPADRPVLLPDPASRLPRARDRPRVDRRARTELARIEQHAFLLLLLGVRPAAAGVRAGYRHARQRRTALDQSRHLGFPVGRGGQADPDRLPGQLPGAPSRQRARQHARRAASRSA